ncbi:pseudouridine synthase [Yoonia sp. 208BN28-4]|uniref:pseudouridine synthase n=1 Tax=Yoonia sp. 208BN28-4 TaxID=3126505 RepID=UPI00309E0B50
MTDDWRHKTDLRLAALETKSAVDAVHRANVADRLGYIEDLLKWMMRLIIGAVIMSAIAFMLRGGLHLTQSLT